MRGGEVLLPLPLPVAVAPGTVVGSSSLSRARQGRMVGR